MNILEVVLFLGSVIGVIALGIWMAKEPDDGDPSDDASDYFLAGRGLTWWLVGFSLIAANISTEQFVGMSGSAANWLGMAIASYEWMAAVTLVLVGFLFLPRFLKAGLFTIPEFLEYRFNWVARLAMAIPAVVTLVFVATSSVIFSGAKFISEYYNTVPVLNNLTAMCWLIALFAAAYVFVGGLKACAWTDLVWGSALILGGVIVMVMAFVQLSERPAEELIQTKVANSDATVADLEEAGFWRRFILLNDGVDDEAVAVHGENGSGGKTHMVRPKEDSEIPWTALLIGLWIPNFFYWGLNQYIVQRTLGSKSLAEGQKGIVFAASMKLIIPFLVVIPGIMAFNLFSGDLHESAAQRNINSVETAGDSSVFTVDRAFVELQPELAWQALQQNAKLADKDLDVSPTDSPERISEQINDYAVIAAETAPNAVAANKLVGYDYDSAFPVLVRNLIKPYPMISWFILAALSGAVISSLASMLNSASTLATMDLYAKVTKETNQQRLVVVGRVFVVLFVLLSAMVAPYLDRFESIFSYIQEFQGFISPGILAVFILGFFSPRTPRYFGWLGIVINVIAYWALMTVLGDWIVGNDLWYADQIAFLDRMAICFFTVLIVGLVVTLINPLKTPVTMPVNEKMDMASSRGAQIAGACVIFVTAGLYYYFW
ncbi:sodium:solute symporter family transporter [Allorhodopirellula solitaria]|uniref:Sodium/glucose cotransporter n=1 Tax=Allorhodopirellula solitaria TaxID=2527987 RepID=A0A5C5XV24_9BACT|nr:sodium/solute symporter [Allorhodopirellula solitaria]TWT66421.1 Sodium/glucose cotransporter [Allorhodopirellula solitaria]